MLDRFPRFSMLALFRDVPSKGRMGIVTNGQPVEERRNAYTNTNEGGHQDPKMVGRSKDPKGTRITVRISERDLEDLQNEARRRNVTVGAVVRGLIRDVLSARAPAPQG